MKLRNSLALGIATVALTTVGAHAQEIDTYSGPGFNYGYANGDLVLAFFSSSDTANGGAGDLGFNIGPVTSFEGLAPGTYSVAGFNGSTVSGQGAPGFGSEDLTSYPTGSLTVPSANTFWTVMGGNASGTITTGVASELWLTGVAAQTPISAPSQATIAGRINTIAGAFNDNTNPDGSGVDSSQATGSYLIPSGLWTGLTTSAINTVSATSDTLGLYSLVPGAGSATELGYFTLTDTSGTFSLSFTVVPEPSTYAAILGALTVGFVLIRRRFGDARLKAVV